MNHGRLIIRGTKIVINTFLNNNFLFLQNLYAINNKTGITNNPLYFVKIESPTAMLLKKNLLFNAKNMLNMTKKVRADST